MNGYEIHRNKKILIILYVILFNYYIHLVAMEKMKIGIIIPDRNDRPDFLANCRRMLENQTVKANEVLVVAAKSGFELDQKDITWRYRLGYDYFRNKGFDCILFIENDDYYAPNYIETITNAWINHGKPDLFGTNYTYYYNLAFKKCVKLTHNRRSTMASTLIKPDLDFPWCKDTEPYTDTHLWMRSGLKGVTYTPEKIIFIGIKHGIGLTGGEFHNNREDYFDRHGFSDSDFRWLVANMDMTSYMFYSEKADQC